MTDPQAGRLYGVHIIEVNRSLPLGAVLDDVVERGEKILDEVEKLAAAAQLPVETELVQARDTGPALVDEAVEWGADLIVMGLPYKRRFGEFNLGKTVPYVLKNANCRVMLFREHREHREEQTSPLPQKAGRPCGPSPSRRHPPPACRAWHGTLTVATFVDNPGC